MSIEILYVDWLLFLTVDRIIPTDAKPKSSVAEQTGLSLILLGRIPPKTGFLVIWLIFFHLFSSSLCRAFIIAMQMSHLMTKPTK